MSHRQPIGTSPRSSASPQRPPDPPHPPFHVLTKPTGSSCNLDCSYCFYLQKASLYPNGSEFRMQPEVQETFIRQYVEGQPQGTREVNLAWQGGEPTLIGLDFFRQAIRLGKKYARPGMQIRHSIQTNGILLDDTWATFLKRNDFLVGISIDGPSQIHDLNRRDKGGQGSHERVIRGLQALQRHGVQFNTLTVVHRDNAGQGAEIYDYLKSIGSCYFQFIPILEHHGAGLTNVGPGGFSEKTQGPPLPPGVRVSDRSLGPEQWGQFLCAVFDRWLEEADVGRIFIQLFDMMLGIALGHRAALCVHDETCGRSGALEHNGDLYQCDHFVEPTHHLGNILQKPLQTMMNSSDQRRFGADKRDLLTKQCRDCQYLRYCWGGCPKDRIALSDDGEVGHNYLCGGYAAFYTHTQPIFEKMAQCNRMGRPASLYGNLEQLRVQAQRQEEAERRARDRGHSGPRNKPGKGPGRNEPCPCGSGKKHKRCCGHP